MAAFAQFGSDLDKATQDKLAQGVRLMEVLKQPQYRPYAMEEQVAILFIAVNGCLMDVAVEKIGDFVRGFLEHLKVHNRDLLDAVAGTGATTADQEEELRRAAESYKQVKR
jgi:F-type H+-transporting ATPase subunit alpha